MKKYFYTLILTALVFYVNLASAQDGKTWITFEPADGTEKGQHIVLVSGDDEYRSEEALPMLAKILSTHHGFKTTVLFAIDPETDEIKPILPA